MNDLTADRDACADIVGEAVKLQEDGRRYTPQGATFTLVARARLAQALADGLIDYSQASRAMGYTGNTRHKMGAALLACLVLGYARLEWEVEP